MIKDDECPLENLKVMENESVGKSEDEENMAADNDEENVEGKKVMHNMFHFL
jgi:hypothetical protein